MLKISTAQLQHLDRSFGDRIYTRLEELAHTLRPDLQNRTTPDVLRQFIDVMREQAGAVGFHTEYEQGVFFSAILLQGRDFHLNPQHPLHEVVHRPDVESRLRANQLLYELERLGGAVASA